MQYQKCYWHFMKKHCQKDDDIRRELISCQLMKI